MLIALYMFITNVVIPQFGAYAQALVKPVTIILITLAGIVMLFGSVGMRISNNLGTTVVSGFFQAISYICRTIISAISWIVRHIFRMIPRVFNGSRQTFVQMGMNALVSNLLAVVVVVVVVAIII